MRPHFLVATAASVALLSGARASTRRKAAPSAWTDSSA